MNYIKCVEEFNRAFGIPVRTVNEFPSKESIDRRIRVCREEFKELLDELTVEGELDYPALAKEIADVLYVTFGACLELGIPIEEVFAEVHASNMSKRNRDGTISKDSFGKVLKGNNYHHPNIEEVLWEAHKATKQDRALNRERDTDAKKSRV